MKNSTPITELSLAAIDVNSVDFDFGYGPDNGDWEEVPVGLLQCNYCEVHVFDDTYVEGDPCPDQGCFVLNTGYLVRPYYVPMMNYYYALPYYEGDPEADQLTLYQSSANVVLVKMVGVDYDEDTYVLALSGGGMDLSWDICHAYILLGYAPPLSFCDLPDFAGQDNRQEPFWTILKACLRSAKAVEQRAVRKTGQLLKYINDALACVECGHPDPHNRVGGCERVTYGSDIEDTPTTRCSCLREPSYRPVDAETVRRP